MNNNSNNFKLGILCLVISLGCTANEDNGSIGRPRQAPVVSIMPLSIAYAKTSINTPIFRCNPIVSDANIQIASYYDDEGFITFAHRNNDSDKWEIVKTDIQQDCSDAHKSISLA